MTDRFGPDSTADEVLQGIDLDGRRILVTGVSSGLGVETVRAERKSSARLAISSKRVPPRRTAQPAEARAESSS